MVRERAYMLSISIHLVWSGTVVVQGRRVAHKLMIKYYLTLKKSLSALEISLNITVQVKSCQIQYAIFFP